MNNLNIVILSCLIWFIFVPKLFTQVTWTKLHQFHAARTNDLVQAATDSNLFYANVANAGIWKSTDGGINWSSTGKLNTNSPDRGLTVSPFDENRVMFISLPGSGAESGVFICTDGGSSWTNIENQFSGEFPYILEFAPSDSLVAYAAGYHDIYKSNDAGFTWTLQNSANPLSESINDIKVDLNNANRLLIATNNQVAISNDAGVSWQTANFDGATSFTSNEIDIVNDTLMVVAGSQGLIISYDNGNNWHGIAVPAGGYSYPGYGYVTVDRSNINHIFITSYGYGVMETVDGGNTWSPFSTGLPSYFGTFSVRSVSHSHSKIIIGGYDSGLYISENGAAWARLDLDFAVGGGDTWVHPLRPNILYHALGSLGIFRSSDNGATWSNINNQINNYKVAGWNIAFHPTHPDTIYFTTTRRVFRTYDGGNNWDWCNNGLPDSSAFWQIVIDPVNPNCVYVYHSGRNSFYRTLDGGDSWLDISSGPNVERPQVIACDPYQAGHVIASCRYGSVNESFDYGDNWTEILNAYPYLYYVFSEITFDPYNQGVLYGCTSSGDPTYDGIWRSNDNGQTWFLWSTNLPNYAIYDLKFSCINPSRMYAVLNRGGLYISNDWGFSWIQQNNGLENLYSYIITTVPENSNERLYFSSYTGVYTALISASGVLENQTPMPLKYELKQNYPNPFNPGTTFEFSIPNTEFVTLKIYNLLGQEVATLVSDKLDAGNHNYSWNASAFSAGVYYYRIAIHSLGNEFEQTRKLILMK